jgi:hypothetical protein
MKYANICRNPPVSDEVSGFVSTIHSLRNFMMKILLEKNQVGNGWVSAVADH